MDSKTVRKTTRLGVPATRPVRLPVAGRAPGSKSTWAASWWRSMALDGEAFRL